MRQDFLKTGNDVFDRLQLEVCHVLHNTKDDLHQERFIGIFPNCLENSKDCHLVCFLGNDLFVTFHCDGKVVLASS